MGVCPLISGPLSSGSVLFQDCIKDQCEFYDKENGKCMITYLKEIKNNTDIIIQKLTDEDYDSIVNVCKNNNKHLKSIDYFISRCNFCDSSMLLASEFFQNKDLDGNGKIYGKDFKISDAPPALKALEDNPFWKEPETTMTMEEYKNSIPESPNEIKGWIKQEFDKILTLSD